MRRASTTVLVAAIVCTGHVALGEKLMFRDELTGREIWRLSNYSTFHEYCHASHPFSYDGRRTACRWYSGKGIVVFDLADGSEAVFGAEHSGSKMRPCFVRGPGRCAIVYSALTATGCSVFLHDLKTGEEREVAKLPPGVTTPCAGVIGPNSEYVLLRGDLNGDGLSDWSLKSLWTDETPRIVWTSPTTAAYANTASPVDAANRLDLSLQICHPEIIRLANRGELTGQYKLSTDAKWQAYIAKLDIATGTVKTYRAKGAKIWAHEAWSGDGEYLHMGGYSWRAGADVPSTSIFILNDPKKCSNHYGTCGRSGRYVAGDSGHDGMERLELTDLWTGEMHNVAHISTPTEPAGKIAQDHGHPAGSPDGTKVLVHSCYDLAGHRLYAIPAQDVHAGDAVIHVETTEGFAPVGKLLIRYGYGAKGMIVGYDRTDAKRFLDCDWGEDTQARLKQAIKREVIPKGSHLITDLAGRLFPDGTRRPRKEYVVVVKQPDPPRGLLATRADDEEAVRLTWRAPASHREVAGYMVYRRKQGGALTPITREPITSCEHIDGSPTDSSYYVRAVEHSGLYGDCSSAVSLVRADVLDSYDVTGCTYVAPGDRPTSDRREVGVRVPIAGDYVIWGRGRAYREREVLHVSVDGRGLPDVQIEGRDWHWLRLASCRLTAGEHTIGLAREETYRVDQTNRVENPGFEEGLEGWTFEESVTILDRTRAHSGKQCAKLTGALTKKKLLQAIDLEVKPEWAYRLSFWMRGEFTKSGAKRYHGPHPNTLGRIAALLEPFPYPRGWVRNGNDFDDEQWHAVEIVFNSPPRNLNGRPVRKVRVMPFWCPWYWGEQIGTVWIDDVSVTELGPRLRPAKVTKLLVTNVEGYEPRGLDGRAAYPFPHATPIPLAGLRQTGRERNSITLAWNASRPGTRGYNVYLNPDSECPATKYFRKRSVWGDTEATLAGLERATSYTARVAASNEDGVEGPAATLQAATSNEVAETHVLEAERAEIVSPMTVRTADGVTFAVTPADPARDELYDREGTGRQTGTITFTFVVKEGGKYRIRGRVFAPNGGSNSFWFSLDGASEVLWNIPASQWTYAPPVAAKLWDLKPGEHVIRVRTREAGTRLDRIIVTNDLRDHATPRDQSGEHR